MIPADLEVSPQTAAQLTRQVIVAGGWTPGTSLEDRVTWWLWQLGVEPTDVSQQYRVGKYHLDYAWVDLRIALEADGLHHRSADGALRDTMRDIWLRSQGWLVFRVDDSIVDDGDALGVQVVRVVMVVTAAKRAAKESMGTGLTPEGWVLWVKDRAARRARKRGDQL